MNEIKKLPMYQCHKTVAAVKIVEITLSNTGASLAFVDDGIVSFINVSQAYMDKHTPFVGGYFVRYEDGYESFSPSDVFEDGYSLPTDEKQEIGSVVAKMRCNTLQTNQWGPQESQKYLKVELGAIYGTEGENKDFSKATPSGACWMQIDSGVPAAKFFEPQADYYVTFRKAPKP